MFMFQAIDDYMKKSRDERRNHLDLSTECIFIGGYDSREFRGLLAHTLKTEIPTGKKVFLCHACHNNRCSNPLHMYWGTPKDNSEDMFLNGKKRSIKPKKTKIQIEERHLELVSKLKKIDRTSYGWVQRAVDELGVSHTHVRRLARRYGLQSYERHSTF